MSWPTQYLEIALGGQQPGLTRGALAARRIMAEVIRGPRNAWFRFERRAHSELAAEALVVPPTHILEGGEFNLLDGLPRTTLAHQFGPAEVVDRRGEGVVAVVADGSRQGFRSELGLGRLR